MSCDVGHLRQNLFSNPSVAYLRHSSFSNPSVASPTSQRILQPFFRFSYVTGSSLTSPGEPPMLHTAVDWQSAVAAGYTNSSNSPCSRPESDSSWTHHRDSSDASRSQSSFSKLSIISSTSQLILQPFHRFTYITAHSPTLLLLHLHHSSLFNPSFTSPTSQALHLIHWNKSSLAAGQCVTPYYTHSHDKNSGSGRNRTATTPSIQPWSCTFRLPSVSIHGPFLGWKNFIKHLSCGSGSHWILCIKKPETGTITG